MSNPYLSELRSKSMKLPLTPGVYIMKDSRNEIIYIGKAKALKNRVSQYFGSDKNHQEKVRKMVSQVRNFDYILTDSEFEALVLECSLIKQHKPKYNILLKDDKGYSYIKVTNDEWRRLSCVKQKVDDGSTYIGPYTSGWFVKNAVEEAHKIFKLPDCTRRFPQDFGKGRPCLNFHIKQCMAPCTGKIKKSDYDECIDGAISFLKGGNNLSIKELTERMNTAAENLEFEYAAKLRDRITAIKRITEKQKVFANKTENQDVISLVRDENNGCFAVLKFNNGRLCDKESFILTDIGESVSARTEFIKRYYIEGGRIPLQITLDGEIEDEDVISEFLSQKAGRKVKFVYPQKGDLYALVEMCRANAAESLAQSKGHQGKEVSALDELGRLLGLKTPPTYIEAYDNSNTSGSENVAGMVVFENGRPLKSAYRKFKIKSFDGQDDFASMNEVISRRIQEYYKNKNSGEGFGRLPDLILLDGGKGQVSAVLPVIENSGLNIPVFGMVKDDNHRTRAITTDGDEIAINSKRQAFTLVSNIQDEVHRFAIGYHRQRRSKKNFSVSLTDIDGIGEKRAKALLKHFRTVKRISEADLIELENAPSMNKKSALAVYNYYHKKNGN